jgi:hypothetical protein
LESQVAALVQALVEAATKSDSRRRSLARVSELPGVGP